MDKPFQFKEFSVHQDQCAMKIGTDGVLLGAWASLKDQSNSILDIGAGTGVLALMLAQRSFAELIDGLEIDENAYEQCVENFENSPWNDRLFCYHAALDEFAEEWDEKYDLIISNPPYFEAPKKDENLSSERKKARFNDILPFVNLLSGVSKLLNEKGLFSVIVPFQNQEEFVKLAKAEKLHLQKLTKVKGNTESPFKRSLMQFGFQQKMVETKTLVIETERHKYTPEYIALTKDF